MIRGNILVRNNKYDDHRFYHVLWKQQPDGIDTSFAIKATDKGRDFSALHFNGFNADAWFQKTWKLHFGKPRWCDLLSSDWYALLQTAQILEVIKTRFIA